MDWKLPRLRTIYEKRKSSVDRAYHSIKPGCRIFIGTGCAIPQYLVESMTKHAHHFADVEMLLGVLSRLVDRGNTVIVIEHNMDVIKCADHIIDLGPEGGERGGEKVAEGTPEEIMMNRDSYTGRFLQKELGAG